MKVSFLPLAEQELDEAFFWYEEQVVGLGNSFLDEFNQSVKRIVAYPALYEQIDNDLRRCLMNRFPYGIIYGIDGEQIIIVALAHLKRRPILGLVEILSKGIGMFSHAIETPQHEYYIYILLPFFSN